METVTTPTTMALRHKLQPLLSDREELIWTGRPKQGIALRNSEFFLIPFSLVFLFMFIAFPTFILSQGGTIPTALWLIFALQGVVVFYLIVGRFLVDAYLRSKVTYGITNRHVIIHHDGGTTQSFEIQGLTHLSVEQHRLGSGTVTIGAKKRENQLVLRGLPMPGQDAYVPPALDLIPDAQRVYELLQELRGERPRESR